MAKENGGIINANMREQNLGDNGLPIQALDRSKLKNFFKKRKRTFKKKITVVAPKQGAIPKRKKQSDHEGISPLKKSAKKKTILRNLD